MKVTKNIVVFTVVALIMGIVVIGTLTLLGGKKTEKFSSVNTGLSTGSAPSMNYEVAKQEVMDTAAEEPLIALDAGTGEMDKVATRNAPASAEMPYPMPPTHEPVVINPFVQTSVDALSTFAMDVDTASYATARNALQSDNMPSSYTVRVEEFVNYFHYNYAPPTDDALAVYVDGAPSPWHGTPDSSSQAAAQTQMVRVGIQGKHVDDNEREDALLTFVIDISGSMSDYNRLPLVKEALYLLVDQLRETDRVAIVVYSDQTRVVLEPTSGANRATIKQAINSLQTEGSTNVEDGLRVGYQLAGDNFKQGEINRIILCSDGVANVGATGPDEIRKTIRDYTAQGVYLTTIGFGMGDYNDTLMEQLADDGNGNYAYVDSLDEARRVLVENLTGMLQVIAKDAKIQVAFNPQVVESYRLLGYENRAVADVDFRNDTVDAGEVGADHTVTALYEMVLYDGRHGTALTATIRYADPETSDVAEVAEPFTTDELALTFDDATPQFQLAVAVAGFAQQLRGDAEPTTPTYDELLAVATPLAEQFTNDDDVQEFVLLLNKAQSLH